MPPLVQDERGSVGVRAMWSAVWHAFVAALFSLPPLLTILIVSGSALILVLALEGLLVSLFPHLVFRRLRLLPQQPRRHESETRRETRAEPVFLAPAPPRAAPRRSAPALRSRLKPVLKVLRTEN